MIDVSRLCRGSSWPLTELRYGEARGPVVVWNTTARCNLRCTHCYAAEAAGELTTPEARSLIEDLVGFGIPVLLLSGGEPLLREDLLELAALASPRTTVSLSTNGTLIDGRWAHRLREAGVSYVGISLDGRRDLHDAFRGVKGAFDRALEGLHACQDAGLRVGVRFTLCGVNLKEVPHMFDLCLREGVDRLCFYHLVPVGRARSLGVLSPQETRQAMDFILKRALEAGDRLQVLTVDNHADGPYLTLWLQRRDPQGAARALELLRANRGARSGLAIGCVDEHGDVHPDQFWRSCTLGNVRQRPFSQIWNGDHPVLRRLRDRSYRSGRCLRCEWFDICGGGLRARAEALTGDPWAPDPGCYLTEEELRVPSSLT